MPLRPHLLLLILLLAPLSALAADPPEAVAKAHYVDGTKHYDVGEYAEALAAFKAGYLAKSDPAFLYNIGQCHRKLGQPEEAADAYRSYLRRSPQAHNRAEVTEFIAEAERQIEARKRAQGAAPVPPQPPVVTAIPVPAVVAPVPAIATSPPPTPPTNEAKPRSKWWIAGVVGGVLVVGAAGAVAGVLLADPGTQAPYYGNVSPGFQSISP